MVFAFLVICNLPISTVNANVNQDEISCNIENQDVTVMVVSDSLQLSLAAHLSFLFDSNEYFSITLAKEAIPPTKAKSHKVYHWNNDYFSQVNDVGKSNMKANIYLKTFSDKKVNRSPRDGLNWVSQSFTDKYLQSV